MAPPAVAADSAGSGDAGIDGFGQLTVSPPGATIGYLPQEPDRRPGETVAQFIARRTGVTAAGDAMQAAAEGMAAEVPGADDDYARELDRWLDLGGADLDERAEAVTAALGLSIDLDHPMTALSGGQAARAGLASLLLSRYDLILLDEPTNDLDLDGLARLEDFVAGRRGGTVLVSHDREFLARTVTRVVELDLAQQHVATYGGGYAGYLAEREVARRHARGQYEEYAQTRAGLEERARTQRNWMEKGVRNARRKATDPDKNVKAFRAESSEKQAAKARQTDRRIERLDVVAEPRKEWELRMEIAVAPRAGAVVAALRGAVVRRGPFTLGPVDLQVDWADRVAITGPNGSGKTTLLGALLGRVALDAGPRRPRPRRRGGRGGPGPRPVPGGRAAAGRLPVRGAGPASGGGPDPAGQVRAGGGSRPAAGLHAVAGGADPGRARAPPGARASTCWSWTSRPTTWTCPPSSSWRPRSRPTPAPCCWSPTTGGCWPRCPPTATSAWTAAGSAATKPALGRARPQKIKHRAGVDSRPARSCNG